MYSVTKRISMVKQPYISDLAQELRMNEKVLSIEDFVENF